MTDAAVVGGSKSKTTQPANSDEEALQTLQDAFALFGQQSQQLEKAYQALKQDLAVSNDMLQSRNQELTSKIQELRQVSSRLESVIESMTDGLLVIDSKGLVERCNSAVERILNRSREKIENMPVDELISMEDIGELLNNVLAGGPSVLNRPWSICLDGEEYSSLMLDLAPVSSPDQHVLGAIVHLRDVTTLHRLEKKLRSSERLAALGEMAASVAHEIRNPLGTIEGFARLLRRDLADMPGPLALTERIVEGAQNLNYVISNLLTYARPMRLQMESFAAGYIFSLCRDTLLDRAARSEVALTIEEPDAQCKAWGDSRQITQVILNLGINAIEACSAAGKVRMGVSASRQNLFFHVCDNGCGLDENQLERIFDPFYTSKEGGTGLGLSLTRKIVDAHGGEITVKSSAEDGTVFCVALPKEESEG